MQTPVSKPILLQKHKRPFLFSFTKKVKIWRRKISITKRQQFVCTVFVLTIGLILTQTLSTDFRLPLVVILSCIAFIGSALVLREGISGIEWITLLTLPTMFTGAMCLFYFLLPNRWLTRIPIALLYAIGVYALLLTENIYNVAAERTIALIRAAHTVGFLLTLVTYFLLLQTIFAFRLDPFLVTIAVTLVSGALVFQTLWAIELEEKASERLISLSLGITVVFAQLAWTLCFWPVNISLKALFLTTAFYSIVGMGQQFLVEKLYKKTVVEFFGVAVIVFVIVMLATSWRSPL